MSDLNVTVGAPFHSLEPAKDGTNTPSRDAQQVGENVQHPKITHKEVESTDFNYAIDRDTQALHLTVKDANGKLVREVIFEKIDVSFFDPKKLKGVFVDEVF